MDPITIFFISEFSSQLISWGVNNRLIPALERKRVESTLKTIIENSLLDSISNFPNTQYISENFDVKGFLANYIVQNELLKILDPYEIPDEDVIYEEWVRHQGLTHDNNIKIIIQGFIFGIIKAFRAVPEFKEQIHHKDTFEIKNHTSNLPSMASDIRHLITLAESSNNVITDPKDIELSAQISMFTKLLKDGFPNACLVQLLKIEENNESLNVSSYLLARTITLIGSCYLALDQQLEAFRYFDRAYTIDPSNPDVISNYSLSLLLQGEYTRALGAADLCLEIQSGNLVAQIVLFECKIKLSGNRNFDQYIEKNQLSNSPYARIVGVAYYKIKDLNKAEEYLSLALSINPDDFLSESYLASILLERKFPSVSFHELSPIDDDSIIIINKAKKMLMHALSIASKRDEPNTKNDIQASLGGLLLLEGKMVEAKQLCESVVISEPDHTVALHNLGIISLYGRELDNATKYLQLLPLQYLVDTGLDFPLLSCLVDSNDLIGSQKLINELKGNPTKNSECYLDYFQSVVYIKTGKKDLAFQLLAKNYKLRENGLQFIETASMIAKYLGDLDLSKKYLLECMEITSNTIEKTRIAISLIDVIFQQQEYPESIAWFSYLPENVLFNKEFSYKYAYSLYQNREYEKSYKFILETKLKGLVFPALLELEVWLLEFLGDLNGAISTVEQLLAMDINNTRSSVEYAKLLFNKGQKEESVRVINGLSANVKTDPWLLIECAELYSFTEHFDLALKNAFIARRIGLKIAEIHLAYLRIFLQVSKRVNLDFEIVKENCAVLLNGENQSRWIKIINDPSPDPGSYEFSTESKIASLCMSCKKGDVIIFQDGQFEKLAYVIGEIQSVYVRAFQETFEEFSTRFPDNYSLQKIDINNNDYIEFFNGVARASSAFEFIYSYYKTGAINLEQFSKLIVRDQNKIFYALLLDNRLSVIATSGTTADQIVNTKTVKSSNNITITLSGLITANYLGFLKILKKRFEHILISQKAIDALQITLISLDFERINGASSVSFESGRFVWNETSPKVISRDIDEFEKILHFARNECEIVPISSDYSQLLTLDMNSPDYIGEVYQTLALVAQQTQTPIYADDYIFAKLCLQKYKINGFCSEFLLSDLQEKEFINYDFYMDALSTLAQSGYYFISVNQGMLYDVCKADNFQISLRTNSLLETLKGPDAIEDLSIGIGCNFLRRILWSLAPNANKTIIVGRVLDILTSGRDQEIVVGKIEKYMKQLLNLDPLHLNQFINIIRLWNRFHSRTQKRMIVTKPSPQ
jgi:tetratricopeptide (TPR) repeat protein